MRRFRIGPSPQPLFVRLAQAGGNDGLGQPLAHGLLGRPAEHLLGLGIPARDDALVVDLHDGIEGRQQDRLRPVPALPQLFLRALALGNVRTDGEHAGHLARLVLQGDPAGQEDGLLAVRLELGFLDIEQRHPFFHDHAVVASAGFHLLSSPGQIIIGLADDVFPSADAGHAGESLVTPEVSTLSVLPENVGGDMGNDPLE